MFCAILQQQAKVLSNVKVGICSLGLSSKVHDKFSAKFESKMAETGDEIFSGTWIFGGQDIHQNSCDLKYF